MRTFTVIFAVIWIMTYTILGDATSKVWSCFYYIGEFILFWLLFFDFLKNEFRLWLKISVYGLLSYFTTQIIIELANVFSIDYLNRSVGLSHLLFAIMFLSQLIYLLIRGKND